MEQKGDAKVCGVCGDRALGYNFNAVTCESCKAFFRRNAMTKKDFKCPFNEQCEITTVTRRFCQKCRLEKCFAIGMKKDHIMSDEEKIVKRQKIEENRAKRRCESNGFKKGFKKMRREHSQDDDDRSMSYTDSDNSGEYTQEPLYTSSPNVISVINYNSTSAVPMIPPQSGEDTNSFTSENFAQQRSPQNDLIRTILNPTPSGSLNGGGGGSSSSGRSDSTGSPPGISNNNNNNNHSNCNHNAQRREVRSNTVDVTRDVLEDVQKIPIEANSIESILCEAIKLEFEAYSSITHCHSSSRELNDAERAKLNELIVANKALLTPLDDDLNGLTEDGRQANPHQALQADPALVDVINLTAVAIRRLIKMAKRINAFKNMCQEDQVALLKGGCTEMMILRSAMNFDPTKQSWKIPHCGDMLDLNVDVLKLAKGNVYQEHERFMKTFDPKWRTDENIVLIMCAIVLFTPDRPRVVHQDVIKLEQNSYYYLLRRYLESIYAGCEAKSTFLKLIQKISELRKVCEEVINVYLDVNPADVEPLLIEIFDLKH